MNTSPICFANAIQGLDFKTLTLILNEYDMLFISNEDAFSSLKPYRGGAEKQELRIILLPLWNLYRGNLHDFFFFLQMLLNSKNSN